ncbi:PKD domain-containing protein [Lutibacter sp.]|uniref:PKD domain-containing protein n=1 Tax=Lutibacter sp. TaxID=1925666 RepID=UPI002735FEF6|nr:PKD domain-containing protein [Lutibacter sp.]MDP3311892.1 PKD domain-containing protein [Lutibacter sp.]
MLHNRLRLFQFLFFFLIVSIVNGQCNTPLLSGVNVSCFGGSDGKATATGVDGTAPYTYSWNTSPVQTTATATGLSAGISYTVTVTDSAIPSCSKTVSITLTQPTALTATSLENKAVSCFGGSDGEATATAYGGTAPYVYDWGLSSASTSATASDLKAGIHTIKIKDANDCETTIPVTISQPTALIATAIQNSGVKCKGESNGSATVTVTGGKLPYTYSWDKSPSLSATALDLAAGRHTVKVKDGNGCEITTTVIITEPATLTAIAVQDSPVKCKGEFNGVATVTVIGGTTPYSFSWDKSIATSATASDLEVGVHTITIKDINGCETKTTVTISEPTILTATAIQNSEVKCKGESNGLATVTVIGGTQPYTYSWNRSTSTSDTAADLATGLHTITITDFNNCTITTSVIITEPTNKLTATAIQNNSVKCKGGSDGSATVIASGGTAPYTYVWKNSSSTIDTATDLKAGVQDITIRDSKGCEISIIVFINEPTILTATAVQFKPVVCNGESNGTAVITAVGGTLPYTYSWDKSSSISAVASDLAAGIHTVKVKDGNGCEITTTVIITEPAKLTATVVQNIPVKCKGESNGSSKVEVVGGTTPYTYVWQNSSSSSATATDLAAGTHGITIKDANGCITTASVVITEPAILAVTVVQNSPVKCKGDSNGSATVTAVDGTTPYTYYWDNNAASSATATNLSAGTHTVKVIDINGCEKIATVLITEPTVLTATAIETSPVKCKGAFNGVATVTPVGGVSPYSYSWDKSTSTSATAIDLGAGLHTITIYDVNDCKTTATVTITELNVLEASAVQFKAVTCNGAADGSAVVTVSGGKTPFTYSWDKSSSTTATATSLAAGIHTVKVKDGNGCEISTTVLITEPVKLTATTIQDSPVKCKGANNGVATVTPVGGTIPYTFTWDKSTSTIATATNLVAGLHTITIKDKNGCETTTTVTIAEPNALALTETVLPIACDKGGSISVLVTGGVSTNYFYDWVGPASFSQSGFNLKSIGNLLTGGTYRLTVSDDNGCSIVKNFTLGAYVPLEYTGSTAVVFDTCNSTPTFGINLIDIRGGIPYVDGNGNPYYSFEWFGPNNFHSSSPIIPIVPGNYIAIISDSQNCKSNQITFTITTPYTPIVVTETVSNVGCDSTNNDGFIAIAVSGGKIPYTIVWEKEIPSSLPGNPNPTYSEIGRNILRVNNLMEGRYRLTVTSDLINCSDSNPAYKFQTIYTVKTQNSITLLEKPILDSKLCAGGAGTLSVKVKDENNGIISFYYNNVLVNAENKGNNNYVVGITNFVPEGVLNIVNEFGCGEAIIIDTRVVEPSFQISSTGFNLNGIINLNEPVTFKNTSTPPYTKLEWDFGDSSDLSVVVSPVHTYAVSGLHDVTLRIYNEFGCYKEYTEQISVGKGFLAVFPDVFTPNRDGVNDYFLGELIGFNSLEFEIYDLWNNLLYATSADVSNATNWGWDGNLSDGSPFNGKIFKYVFKGINKLGKEVVVSNQALLLR